MEDYGFISLGKYSSARDSILHYLCTSEWSNDSFGDVEAPTGYVWRITNNNDDVFGCFNQGNGEFNSLLEEWLSWNSEVTDSRELRKELVGHFLVVEDNNGLVSVYPYPSAEQLMKAYNSIEEIFNEWNNQDEDEDEDEGKGTMEFDSLSIPAGMIRIGDGFYAKGQFHDVRRIEPLTQYLIRLHCNVMSFDAALVVDSRLIFPAVIRAVPNEGNTK